MNNKELKPCCRKINNLDIEIRKSDENLKSADMAVFRCVCNRHHIRLALGGNGSQ